MKHIKPAKGFKYKTLCCTKVALFLCAADFWKSDPETIPTASLQHFTWGVGNYTTFNVSEQAEIAGEQGI